MKKPYASGDKLLIGFYPTSAIDYSSSRDDHSDYRYHVIRTCILHLKVVACSSFSIPPSA
jgi:hypothetical protein